MLRGRRPSEVRRVSSSRNDPVFKRLSIFSRLAGLLASQLRSFAQPERKILGFDWTRSNAVAIGRRRSPIVCVSVCASVCFVRLLRLGCWNQWFRPGAVTPSSRRLHWVSADFGRGLSRVTEFDGRPLESSSRADESSSGGPDP